jgi:ammonia channel protein AmtB
MTTHESLSNQMTRFMDFAGGTVIHISFLGTCVLLGMPVLALIIWRIVKSRL